MTNFTSSHSRGTSFDRVVLCQTLAAILIAFGTLVGCEDREQDETPDPASGTTSGTASAQTRSPTRPAAIPANLPNALLIAYAQFEVENGQVTARPGPARLEILRRAGGEWRVEAIEDEDSRVFS